MDQRVWEGRPYWSKQRRLGLVRIEEVRGVGLLVVRGEYGAVNFKGGEVLEKPGEKKRFALREGFNSWNDLVDYFIQKKDAIHGAWIAQDLYTWNPMTRKS